MAISEQDYLYGKLVCEFVNAKKIDDALSSLYYNLQKAFRFSPGFPEKAKSVFPTSEFYKSQFSTWDAELQSLLFRMYLMGERFALLINSLGKPGTKWSYNSLSDIFELEKKSMRSFIAYSDDSAM